jgi:hypothetical protein
VRFHRWFVCADLSAILPCLLCVSYRTLGQFHALSCCAFLMDIWVTRAPRTPYRPKVP